MLFEIGYIASNIEVTLSMFGVSSPYASKRNR